MPNTPESYITIQLFVSFTFNVPRPNLSARQSEGEPVLEPMVGKSY
jgi:hypothetical protein